MVCSSPHQIRWDETDVEFFDVIGVINWPDLQKDPDVGVAPVRPAPSASTTGSTVDLVKDPYALPPLPVNTRGAYRDDPSIFYDPYRGTIPQTFTSPPKSPDPHPHAWSGGAAIPLTTYASR